jgi:hypothetical protein
MHKFTLPPPPPTSAVSVPLCPVLQHDDYGKNGITVIMARLAVMARADAPWVWRSLVLTAA